MSKIWREIADPEKHRDFMSTTVEGGIPIKKSRDNLIEKWVYFAKVNDFVFQFADLDQVREARAYFSRKIHPSTMNKNYIPHEHYWHPWYAKLPKGLTKEKNRIKVLKSLDEILSKWGGAL